MFFFCDITRFQKATLQSLTCKDMTMTIWSVPVVSGCWTKPVNGNNNRSRKCKAFWSIQTKQSELLALSGAPVRQENICPRLKTSDASFLLLLFLSLRSEKPIALFTYSHVSLGVFYCFVLFFISHIEDFVIGISRKTRQSNHCPGQRFCSDVVQLCSVCMKTFDL